MAPGSRIVFNHTASPQSRPSSPTRSSTSLSSLRDDPTPHFFSTSSFDDERDEREQAVDADERPDRDDDETTVGDSFVVAEPEGMPVGTRVDLNPPREKEEVEGAIPLHLSASSPPFRTVPTEEEGEGEGFVPQRPGMDGRTPAKRFQAAGRRAMPVNRAISYRKGWDQVPTREPGIDPEHVDLPDLVAKCVIQVVDCCRADAKFTVLENAGLPAFLAKPRPLWSKVRWIHVNGLSWDVIKPLAVQYHLHPLSLEDMLHHGTASTRSKADWYKQHLFVSAIVHKTFASENENTDSDEPIPDDREPEKGKRNHLREQLGFHSRHTGDDESRIEGPGSRSNPNLNSTSTESTLSNFSSSSSYEKYKRDLDLVFLSFDAPIEERTLNTNDHGLTKGLSLPKGTRAEELAEREAARSAVTALTKDVKVHIHVEQLSIFLLRDGTVLSFCQDPGQHARYSSIFDRVQSASNLIRETEDPSFVLQALLDVVADHALEIVDEFRDQITKLESHVLARPSMSDVRHLHVLSAQLLLLKSTLSPLQHLLQGIRVQDDTKAASASRLSVDESVRRGMGFVSYECKIYLEDVIDHVESVISSLDLFSSLAENLIAFTFNNLSYTSNAYMQALSVLSVIFLPLTFLSGYFGMNFAIFPGALDNSVTYFWEIAAPVCFGTIVIFCWTYLSELAETLRRELLRFRHTVVAKNYAKEL